MLEASSLGSMRSLGAWTRRAGIEFQGLAKGDGTPKTLNPES